jgi:hypothetical protein
MPPWRNWIAHPTTNRKVTGSNPVGGTTNTCRCGGIGRHAGLRNQCRKACEFDSRHLYKRIQNKHYSVYFELIIIKSGLNYTE